VYRCKIEILIEERTIRMKTRQRIILSILLVNLLFAAFALGQSKREINFPDILGYKTLKCDFHMHTVFSDGSVWPSVRVDEAWREGLDAISITDHIEYQPHKNDLPTNHGRSHDLAVSRARERNILLIKGAEFTRETPPGHFNAIFINDANALDVEDLVEGIKIANKQGAFVFWNHPGWKPEHKGWFETHTILYENKLMHGIEVVNGGSYYPEAHEWCLEKNLTMLGTSDVHQPLTLLETSPEDHRSITLVFARQRSIDAIKEALVKGRTAVWYKDQLIGKKRFLNAIFKESVEIGKPYNKYRGSIWVEITNNSDIDINLERAGTVGPRQLTLAANATTILRTGTGAKAEEAPAKIELSYTARNFLIAPGKGLPVTLTISLK
jgi:hypothetical protein